MKFFLRTVSLLLAVTMLVPMTAFATETAEPRVSNYFLSHGAYIDEISSTTFEVWFSVTAVTGMDVLGVKSIKIQRSADHDDWETQKTYSKDSYSNLTATDTGAHSGYITYKDRSPGYYYRAVVTFYAKNSSGTGEYTIATSSI